MNKKYDITKIRGRKPGNPNMESKLNQWIINHVTNDIYVTQTEIRNKAK